MTWDDGSGALTTDLLSQSLPVIDRSTVSSHGDRLRAVDPFATGRDFLEREGRLLERRLFATVF